MGSSPPDFPETATDTDGDADGGLVAVLRSPRLRLTVFAVVVVGVAVAIALIGGPRRAEVLDLVRNAGPAAPVAFVALYAVFAILLLPGAVMTIVGGVVFGPYVGTALSVVGATVGAWGAFVAGRRLGRTQVEKIAGKRLQRFDDWLGRRGLVAVLYLRLVPAVPFNVLNYAAGVTAVTLRDYLIGTAVGIVPGTFAYAALGGSFDDPLSPVFLSAAGLLVVLAVGAPLVDRYLRRRGAVPESADGESGEANRDAVAPDPNDASPRR